MSQWMASRPGDAEERLRKSKEAAYNLHAWPRTLHAATAAQLPLFEGWGAQMLAKALA